MVCYCFLAFTGSSGVYELIISSNYNLLYCITIEIEM